MSLNKLALAAGMFLVSGCAFGTQILTNPDFETGSTSPWINDNTYQAGPSWTIISSGCESGTYCVSVTGNVGLEQVFSGVLTPLITSADFWVNPTNSIAIALLYQGGGIDWFFFNPTGGQLNTWNNIDLMPDLRPSASLIGIDVFGTTSSVTKLDDFSILGTIPEPGAFWLLAAGLGTVGALARARKNARKSF